jgi:hypothetical protein
LPRPAALAAIAYTPPTIAFGLKLLYSFYNLSVAEAVSFVFTYNYLIDGTNLSIILPSKLPFKIFPKSFPSDLISDSYSRNFCQFFNNEEISLELLTSLIA